MTNDETFVTMALRRHVLIPHKREVSISNMFRFCRALDKTEDEVTFNE